MAEKYQDRGIDKVPPRRNFFINFFMLTGLTVSYGLFGGIITRFLYPGRKKIQKTKMFLTTLSELAPNASIKFTTPAGENYWLTPTDEPRSFKAFSTRCPHLGCNVDWISEKKHYYCPCHNGIFNENGIATAGPPAKAGQSLKSTEVVVEGNAIYAMVEVE